VSSVGNITSELSFPRHFRTIWNFCHCRNNTLSLHNRKLSLHILCITAQYFRPWTTCYHDFAPSSASAPFLTLVRLHGTDCPKTLNLTSLTFENFLKLYF